MKKYLIVLLTVLTVFYSCQKEFEINKISENQINQTFYSRNTRVVNSTIKTFSTDYLTSPISSSSTLIDTLLASLKKSDSIYGFSDKIIKNYGKPLWDLSIQIKNDNKYFTIITPIVDSNNNVEKIIISYQYDKSFFKCKIINKKTEQKQLPEFGDKLAVMFTKKTLEGLFSNFNYFIKNTYISQENIKIQSNSQNSLKSNAIIVNYTCWYYVSSGPDYFLISNTQCSYNVTITNDGFSGLNSSFEIPGSGGGSSSSTSDNTYESSYEGLNDEGDTGDSDPENLIGISPRKLLPNKINLANGKTIQVTYTKTSDGAFSQNNVSEKLINALQKALEFATLTKDITSINISASTNGLHSANSNHYKALAIDISKINGYAVSSSSTSSLVHDLVYALQQGFELSSGRRENFGPALKLKNGIYNRIGNHENHIHLSVNDDF